MEMAGGAEQIDEEIDEVDGRGLEAELAQIAGHLNVQHAVLVDVTVRALASSVWCGFGIHSPAQWLTLQLGVSPAHAGQIVAIAERIAGFPCLRASFGRGELSLDQVHVVATKAPAWADARVTEFARSATVRQLHRAMRDEHFEPDPDEPQPETRPDPGPKAETVPVRDRVSFGWDEHSRFGLHANLAPDDGAIVEAALNEARDALFHAGDTDVTWCDALLEVCQRSLGTAPSTRRERFKTYLHLAVDDVAQFTNGVTLPSHVADYLLCDATIQPVWERDHIPVGVGRSQRIVPDRTRRLVEHRDQGCRIPGCGRGHVEIHHIIHWQDGGVTETWNLVSLCPRHHKLHHRGLLRIAGNADTPDGLTITTASGQPIGRCRPPTPPTEPSPPGNYRRPSGERLDTHWIEWVHPNALARRAELNRRHHERRQRDRDHAAHPDHEPKRSPPPPPG